MLRTKTLKPLAITALIAILAMTGSAQGAEKKRRRFMQNLNDPYLAFVPGKPLLFAAERGRSVLSLRYPELEVDRTFEVPADRKLDIIKGSPGGTWIAGFFERSNLRSEGTLRVWNLATGETGLLLDDASRAFEFMADNRLIVWQPKSGITQWVLGESEAVRVGPVITAATLVQVNIGSKGLYLSSDARYVLTKGTCRDGEANAKPDWWDYCLFDLNDGATVGWSEDPDPMGTTISTWWRGNEERDGPKFSRQFSELLIATNITGGEPSASCTPAGQNRELCSDPGAVSLIETVVSAEGEKPTEPPPASAEAPTAAPTPKRPASLKDVFRTFKEIGQAVAETAKAARAAQNSAPKGKRVLWTIRAGDEIGRFINSCVLSADGRWVAVASMGVTVSIFDTEHLESKKNLLNGAWQEPIMVKQFEMP